MAHRSHNKCSLTYYSWRSMIRRCYEPNHKSYKNYGARGISVCDRWRGKDGLKNFIEDIGERPSKERTIDRIFVTEGYHKHNCRWADDPTQRANKRRKAYA